MKNACAASRTKNQALESPSAHPKMVTAGQPPPKDHRKLPHRVGELPTPAGRIIPGEKKGASHVHTPALVHSLRALLATGHAGVDRVSLHLAAAAPLSHPGSRCPRSSGDRLSSHHATLPPADSAVSDLNCGGFSVVAGEVVETLPCNLSFPAEKHNPLSLYARG